MTTLTTVIKPRADKIEGRIAFVVCVSVMHTVRATLTATSCGQHHSMNCCEH